MEQMDTGAATTDSPPPTGSRATTPVALAILAVVVGAYVFASRPVPPLVGWGDDLHEAMQQATASDRNVLVVFQLPGCPPCRRMERSVLPDPKVTRALASLVPVQLDLSQTPQLSERYQVWGTPTYLLLDPQGRLLARDSGYRSVDEFVSFLSRASQ